MPMSVSAIMQYAGTVTFPLPDIPVAFSGVYVIAQFRLAALQASYIMEMAKSRSLT